MALGTIITPESVTMENKIEDIKETESLKESSIKLKSSGSSSSSYRTLQSLNGVNEYGGKSSSLLETIDVKPESSQSDVNNTETVKRTFEQRFTETGIPSEDKTNEQINSTEKQKWTAAELGKQISENNIQNVESQKIDSSEIAYNLGYESVANNNITSNIDGISTDIQTGGQTLEAKTFTSDSQIQLMPSNTEMESEINATMEFNPSDSQTQYTSFNPTNNPQVSSATAFQNNAEIEINKNIVMNNKINTIK